MKKIFTLFLVFNCVLATWAVEHTRNTAESYKEKNMSGYFSVSANKYVKFSQGNLQYRASTDTWRFAEEQYDCVDMETNMSISQTFDQWVDLLKFASSGYNELYPWSETHYNTSNSIANTNYDWGQYNVIINGGNTAGLWRTMTIDEWWYLFYFRDNASSLFAFATVVNQPGIILLPDNFTTTTLNTGEGYLDWNSNVLNAEEWQSFEDKGGVFLPANGSILNDPNVIQGFYWSSTVGDYCKDCSDPYGAFAWFFKSDECRSTDPDNVRGGRSVRLVRDTTVFYNVEVITNNNTQGYTNGSGQYLFGDWATIEAIAYEGYHFTQWSDGNTDNPRLIQVTKDINHTAYFEINTYDIIKNCNSEQGYINGVSSAKHLGKVTFTAIANSDYQFTQWSDGVKDNPRTLVITQDTTITAEFKRIRFQAGNLYYQICNADGLMSVVADTASWNIPTGALTVAQAREVCAALEPGATTGTKYYVKGWVKKIHSKHADGVSLYGNAQFYMEDVRGANSPNNFCAYQVYGPGGNKLTNPEQVMVGDFVVIYGELTKYQYDANSDPLYETVGKGASYIWKSTNPLLADYNIGEGDDSGDSGNTENGGSTTDSDIIIPENAILFDADVDQGNATTDYNLIDAFTITKEGITLDASRGYLGTYNNEMNYRITKNSTLTITSTRGNIKEIVFTCTANNDEKYGPGCFSFDSGEYVYSGANGQWKGDASEVVFTAAINQVRATQIAVVVEDRVSTTSANKVHVSKPTNDTNNYVVVTYQNWNNSNNYSDLTTVNIPSEVEHEGVTYKVIGIGYDAFARNYTISDMVIPKHIESIGEMAFYGASISSIYFEHSTPPIVSPTTFGGSYPIIYVPCGSIDAYQSAFNRLVEEYPAMYTVHLATFGKGHTDVLKNTLCEAQISATADFGYHFVQWSDGVTDNPRILVLTQDTVLAAQFAQSFSGQCGDNLYWNYDPDTKTIAITGSGEMYDYTATTQPWSLFKEEILKLTTSATTTTLGESAFDGCVRLGEATLGVGIERLKTNVFAECNRLYHIYSYPTYTPFADQSSFANYNVYLHVPCESFEMYNLDVVFGNFKYIECLGSDKVTTEPDSVKLEPSTNSVTITWPTDENADTYSIEIKRGDVVFCTLTFNKDGMLTNIAFAPSRTGSHPATYAASTGNGLRFTVTSLDAGTTYAYDITTKDVGDNTISTYTGEFTTKSNVTTDMDNIQSQTSNTRKLLRSGQLIILREGKTYNVMGAQAD